MVEIRESPSFLCKFGATSLPSDQSDYNDKPSSLFCFIENQEWNDAISRCKNNPNEVSIWMVRKAYDESISWKKLPLHEACIRQAPLQLIEMLISICLEAVQAVDHNERLPLHHACVHGANPDVIQALLLAYPESINKIDLWGKNAKAIVEASSNSRSKNEIIALLEKGSLFYTKKIVEMRLANKMNKQKESYDLQLEEARSQIIKLKLQHVEDHAEMESKVDEITTKYIGSTEKFDQLEVKFNGLSLKCSAMEKKIKDMLNLDADKEKIINNLKEEKQKLFDDVECQNEKIMTLTNTISHNMTDKNAKEKTIEELKQVIVEEIEKNKKLTSKIIEKECEINEKTLETQKYHVECLSLRASTLDLNEKILTNEGESKQVISELTQDKNRLLDETKLKDKEISNLTDNIEQNTATIKMYENEIRQLGATINIQKEEAKRGEEERNNLVLEIEKKEKSIHQLKENMARLANNIVLNESDIEELKGTVVSRDEEISSCKKAINTLLEEVEIKENSIREEKENVASLANNIILNESNIEELKATVFSRDEDISSCKKKINILMQEVEIKNAAIKDFEADVIRHLNEIDVLKKSNNDLQDVLEEYKEKNAQLCDEVASSKNTITLMKETQNKLNDDLTSCRDCVEKLKTVKEEEEGKLMKSLEECKYELVAKEAELTKKIQLLTANITSEKEERKREIKNLEDSLSGMKATETQLRSLLASSISKFSENQKLISNSVYTQKKLLEHIEQEQSDIVDLMNKGAQDVDDLAAAAAFSKVPQPSEILY